ncbi:MAG: hypothetical protein KAR38_06490 [Calditrichia bacterium]|nr:hypothetical protein [Calditrichia bacterium]
MKKIGIIENLFIQPLHYVLENKIMSIDYEVIKGSEEEIAKKLKNREVELAEISPVEYAKNPGEYKVIPDICTAIENFSGDSFLFFNEGKMEFKKMAYATKNKMSRILAKIIINEKFEMEPDIIDEADGQIQIAELLEKYDAVLIDGEAAIIGKQKYKNFFNLGEEWVDFTGLPLVTTFWAAKNENINEKIIDVLQRSRNTGLKYLPEIIKNSSLTAIVGIEELKTNFRNNYFYKFKEEYLEGLKKFWEYAFYYAEIEHVPEIHYFE